MNTKEAIKSAGLDINWYLEESKSLTREIEKIIETGEGSEEYATKKAENSISLFKEAREERARVAGQTKITTIV